MYTTAAGAANGRTNRPRPVLMIPLRRCGSHQFRLRLSFNKDFYSPYPLHPIEFMNLVPLYGDLASDEAYFQLIVDVVGLQTVNLRKWPDIVFDPVEIFETLKNECRSVHRVFWELLLYAGEKRDAKIVMDKSLDNIFFADEILSLFPDALFVLVHRHPCAQVASMNRAIIHDFDTTLNAITWVAAHRAAQDLVSRHPDKVLTISFEEFIDTPEPVLQKICGFIGMEFMREMMEVEQSDEARQIAKLSTLWESNSSAPIKENIDKWRRQLSQDEVEVIETITGEFMDLYGYERITPGNAVITETSITEARKRSDVNKRNAWTNLKARDFRDYTLRRFRADYLARIKARLETTVRDVEMSKEKQQPTCA